MNNSQDYTKEQLQKEEIRKLAECDYLTGLANRRGLYTFFENLDRDQNIHAMFIDIDNFKRVNDTYGHSIGDELLIAIAHLIQNNTSGFTSRIGGDEYVVLLKGENTQDLLEEKAKRLLEEMQNLDFRKDILSLISLSIGIVMDQKTDIPLDDILAKCDAAMYQAKFNGKNCYTIYKTYEKEIEISRNIEMEMEGALADGQFQVYFQPKVNMITSELYGAEALSRWVHPKDGVRSPFLYIPLFEKNGFIAKLDMYIYEQLCKIKSTWKGEKYEHVPISFNISRLHLYNKEFPNQLVEIADKYGIPTTELEIEITESVFIKDTAELIRMVDMLEEKGFRVSIDDFGSGYSALNLLKDIPVNTIKIDKEFLQVSSNNSRGKKVIRNVIAMCRDLKLDVVTEGIETKEQVDFITSCGCQIAQGFYYAQPIPEEEFIVFANEHLTNKLDAFVFRLNGNLDSEDGEYVAKYIGEKTIYNQGIYNDSKSLYFPGGLMEQECVEIPPETMVNDSFTISMWIRPKTSHLWSAALYVKFETGFCAIVPTAWEGHSSFRIRDSKEVNGWYDLSAVSLWENKWTHYVVTYNAKTETAVVFLNGEVAARRDNIPTNRYVKRIMLGGDVFQPSFHGDICEIEIYNETKDYDFVKELHQSYVKAPGFIGFETE